MLLNDKSDRYLFFMIPMRLFPMQAYTTLCWDKSLWSIYSGSDRYPELLIIFSFLDLSSNMSCIYICIYTQIILHTKKRGAHEFTLGMPTDQRQMSIKEFEGEAMREAQASERFFFNPSQAASGRVHWKSSTRLSSVSSQQSHPAEAVSPIQTPSTRRKKRISG